METAVKLAKAKLTALGWREWEVGRTNNAIELWKESDISAEDLLGLVDGLEAAMDLMGRYQDVRQKMSETGDEDRLDELEQEEEALQQELSRLTFLPQGCAAGQFPSGELYNALIRKILILAATRDH